MPDRVDLVTVAGLRCYSREIFASALGVTKSLSILPEPSRVWALYRKAIEGSLYERAGC